MDEILPSYETAVARDAWVIIAHSIPSRDLCAVSLVCRRWHQLFIPFLWGDPASHFGTDNDAVYVALTRFRRTLRYARLEVRMLTHTLHLPPALSEIYGGPRPEWLREVLEYLPCLQSLMVSELPFFDHNSMVALKSPQRNSRSVEPGDDPQTYNIRLLLAEREPNTTSQGLAEALIRFPLLIYLDLSFTKPARDLLVLASLSQLTNLQVLKLRGLGLKDNDAEFLANAIGTRVRFLDLRDNLLTDMAVRSLLQASFLSPNAPRDPGSGSQFALTSSPSDLLRRPSLDEAFLKILTQPVTGRLMVEDLPHVGITHLYISGNHLSVEGAASLLASTRLHVLDVGTVDTANVINKGPRAAHSTDSHRLPGAEKLIPILGSSAKDNLTYLRAHHAVVTVDAPATTTTSSNDLLPELSGALTHTELNASHDAELDAAQEIYELPADTLTRYELADTSIVEPAASPSPATQGSPQKPALCEDKPLPRRGSVFAPEVVEPKANEDSTSVLLDAREAELVSSPQITEGPFASLSSTKIDLPETTAQASSQPASGDPRSRLIKELLSKRPKRQGPPLRHNNKDNMLLHFHPSYLPHLETLVLTDVPSHVSRNSGIIDSIILFITACSNEALLATLQAGSDYSLPPGRARLKAELHRARTLFSLRHLVLEITPTTKLQGPSKLTSWKPRNQRGISKSSTGDRDSENLWSAAMSDFSFFGEEECGIPRNDPGKYVPMAILNEKVSLVSDTESTHSGMSNSDFPSSPQSPGHHQRQPNQNTSQRSHRRETVTSMPASSSMGSLADFSVLDGTAAGTAVPDDEVADIDLVAELAAFRRRKKAEFESLVQADRRRRSAMEASSASPSTLTLLSPTPTSPSFSSPWRSPSPSPGLTKGSVPPYIEGHWRGEVKIVRNAAPKGRSGVVDMYGNYFEKGYLYP
ncbi:hypothetical protein ASPZODRAFT_131009 [Penicilliopsis zonata CBS 506.65]|uniref:F-box domain-containing protein n=1 Tax=Penicilliopsis zonata CBS 506.65 TaxID=1073090 RepID=A0A1L9SK87_9EURO|nr:hypothetical protein ASPZODRAFT_131009 [Penicilliopsis zonata CBS 506.65]OJJ47506.1 hypothetical protein ASPZODRAFT_131009 [Penicilliopsis zonata CBS 506.65]